MRVAQGEFLPDDDPRRRAPSSCSAPRWRASSSATPIRSARASRIGGQRYRVIGVMESKGQVLGFDLDDAVYIPARARWSCSTARA